MLAYFSYLFYFTLKATSLRHNFSHNSQPFADFTTCRVILSAYFKVMHILGIYILVVVHCVAQRL